MLDNYRDAVKMEEEISFISGSTQTMIFNVLDRNGDPLELTGCEIKWTLSYMGQNSNPILIKDNKLKGGVIINGVGEFAVTLTPQDTTILETNKYEHEPIIIQPNGKILRPSYGVLIIRKGASY